MSEEYTEQQTREAFAAARVEVLTYVRPAGAAQVMQAGRRHRRNSTVALVAAVAVAVAGVATATNLVVANRSAAPVAPSPSPPTPTLAPVALKALAGRAAAAIGVGDVDNKERRKQGKGSIIMGGSQPVDRAQSGISGTAFNENKSGDYLYEIACVGQGTLRAHFWAGPSNAETDKDRQAHPSHRFTVPPDAAELRVTCSDHPTKATARAHAAYPRLVYVSVDADQAAVGHAGYADLVRIPNRDGS
jgi:hypothetical protein